MTTIQSGAGRPYFKVMHSDTFKTLMTSNVRKYIHRLPSEFKYWAVVSVLHILNIEEKVMRKDISRLFHSKRPDRILTLDDVVYLRENYQKIYLEALNLLITSKPSPGGLYKAYKNRLKGLSLEEFNQFVNSVLRTVAEREADELNVVSCNKNFLSGKH